MRIGIGIDTGGTYTDAVVYDFAAAKICGTAKALTTKEDLSLGILEAIDGLPGDLVRQAESIALSTTLATNTCVEDQGGAAKLIFFGGDPRIIEENGGKYGLPPAGEICIPPALPSDRYTPDWDAYCRLLEEGFDQLDGVGIIEMNALHNGGAVEEKAKALFQERYSLPVVCGNELFSALNCLQRGASTLLNARLFPVIQSFLAAVKKALAERQIPARLVIVRSDGSLMSEEFAAGHPVETLLCGPAASTIGGVRLAGAADSLIVDMGGTTTDISLVKGGRPVSVMDGVSIGKWKTFVDGLYVKTFGLGGDSAVHYHDKQLVLEEYRIVPLCVAAHRYPAMLDSLRETVENKRRHTRFLYEHLLLVRDIRGSGRYTPEEEALCAALLDGPLPLASAAEAIGRDIYTLPLKRLLRDGVLQLCGLTPTDIMHIRGDFTRYCTEASRLAAEFAAFNLDVSVEEFCELVYTEIKRKMYVRIVEVLLENKYPRYAAEGIPDSVERFIRESYEAARTGKQDPLLFIPFHTAFTLVGIGAPIRVFLEDVAALLGTRAVFPEHYEVANALGAVIGNASASCSVNIRPNSSAEGATGYTVYGTGGTRSFDELEDAEAYAVAEAKKAAREKAVRHGAAGKIAVTCEIQPQEANSKLGTIYLGTTVTATAVGAMGF